MATGDAEFMQLTRQIEAIGLSWSAGTYWERTTLFKKVTDKKHALNRKGYRADVGDSVRRYQVVAQPTALQALKQAVMGWKATKDSDKKGPLKPPPGRLN